MSLEALGYLYSEAIASSFENETVKVVALRIQNDSDQLKFNVTCVQMSCL